MNKTISTFLSVFVFATILFALLNFTACDEGPNSPSKVEGIITKWEVDTISYPGSFQTIMNTIWGSTINDIWIAGHNNRGFGKTFHFDGKEWKDFLPIQSTIFDTYNFSTSLVAKDEIFLCGSALFFKNDTVFSISDSSLILSYKENQWKISLLGGGRPIETISGSKNGKIYAAGRDLTFFSFENGIWRKKGIDISIPLFYETKSISGILVDQNQQGYMFIFCYNGNPYMEKKYFLKEEDDKWSVIDSIESPLAITRFGSKFWESNNGTIYSYNPGIYKYLSTWSNIWNKNELITTMKTTSRGNIFAAGKGVYFYDGSKWTEYKEFYNKFGLARDILILKNTVLILFSNSNNSFVLKGYE